jgi:hypothetical protein
VTLPAGESQQVEDRHPAGQRLRDAFHHLELLGTCQPEHARPAVGIDSHLD